MCKIYLDNCCYNRPFDNQRDAAIAIETQAKMFIQSLIRYRVVELAYSLITMQEIADSPFTENAQSIIDFIEDNARYYVGKDSGETAIALTREIMQSGIKLKDAMHMAYAVMAQCDYFITTDNKLTKTTLKKMKIINPIDFIRETENHLEN